MYIPFLKLKSNEVAAIKSIDSSLIENLVPFFDIPRKKDLDETTLKKSIDKGIKKIQKHLTELQCFYIDNFDIDDSIDIEGQYNYNYILEKCVDLPVIPVVSIDRCIDHITAILNSIEKGYIGSKVLALRFVQSDFEMFELIENDLEEMLGDLINQFEQIDLIFDNRICNSDVVLISTKIIDFAQKFSAKYNIRNIVSTGSSIDSITRNMVDTESQNSIDRYELEIFNKIKKELVSNTVIFADYGIVSPDYSDVDLPPQMLRTIMAPKIIYSYENYHFIARGGALASHPRGDDQYFDLAKIIVDSDFFRGKTYSYGDAFLEEKSKSLNGGVTASSILKPTINAHLVYMLNHI